MITVWKETKLRCNPHARYTAPDGTKHVKVPTDLYEEIAEPEVPEDYSPDTYYRTEQDEAPYVVFTKKSEEQLSELRLVKAKIERQVTVDAIKVTTTTGKEFDGDEAAQARMSRAIQVAQIANIPSTAWVLANNIPTEVTLQELQEALVLSIQAMGAVWAAPYIE